MSRKHRHATGTSRWRAIVPALLAWLTACTPIAGLNQNAAGRGPEESARLDSGTVQIATAASPKVIADPVEPCSMLGARACANNETRTPLECDGTRWVRQTSCAEDEHCDAAPGASQGRCTPIPAECVGRRSGEEYCSDADIRACTAFVPSVVRSCAAAERCMHTNNKAECVCAFGMIEQGGRCVLATDCTKEQGGCDPLTTCSVIAGDRTCGPCPDSFSGDGLRGCMPQLKSLELQGVQLTPSFAADVTKYNVKLPLLRQRLALKAVAPPKTRIEINGTPVGADGVWSSAVLPVGKHMLAVTLSAESGLNSRYELMIDHTGVQDISVHPNVTDDEDAFGYGLDISGDTLVVGAAYEDSAACCVNGDASNNSAADSGAAYVFVREGERWTQQAFLKSDAPSANDFFGVSVAVSGDTVAVSAIRASPYGNLSSTRNGLVYVFKRVGGTWSQQAKLLAPDAAGADLFGYALALQNDRLVVGAPFESSAARQSGAVYVFTRTGDTWGVPAKVKATEPSAEAYLGWSVALDGDTLVAGAHHDNQASVAANPNPGAAHVFTLRDARWTAQQQLQAPQPQGADLFGWSVALRGDTAVIGSPQGDLATNTTCRSGRAYVFDRVGERWMPPATLEPTTPRDCDFFGTSVAIADGSLVIGANGDASTAEAHGSGAIYVYARADAPSTSWTRTGFLKAQMLKRDAAFGKRVAVSADAIGVTAPLEDGPGLVHVLR